jgi:catalase
MTDNRETLTTSIGSPVDDNQNSLLAGEYGPVLLQDFHLIDKLAHFDRERIPERVVHAKGAGAHGYFEVTHDITKFCKAKVFETVGKRTPVFLRFSTVGGEKGSADTERDPRGFAIKFYTDEGNWDMTGNNTPVFFIRDPSKFPDFIHTQKRHPQTNLKCANMFWDFLSLTPESIHQVTILFSDRGTPDGYRHMNGYGSHTFKWVNKNGEAFYVKWHFKTDSGVKNLTAAEADRLKSEDGDYATRDLFNHIARGGSATWTFQAQVMPEADAANYKWNIFDVTKVWPHGDYPLIPVGKLVLNRNPQNYFAETEQAAFSPGHMVPGIEPTNDRMLQGRLFSYPDTHRHRLGANYDQIPINCPFKARVSNNQRDGPMCVNGNKGAALNYEPNSFGGPVENKAFALSSFRVSGLVQRYRPAHPNCDFAQPGQLFRKVMNPQDRTNLIGNIVGHLKNANRDIQERQVKIFTKADGEYGARVAQGLGFPAVPSRL